MARIEVLPEAVIRRIAAGEVVERPVSVVKELVENALDAGATRLDVEIEKGGLTSIAITDDGSGMTRDEVEMAFRRHATSKIRSDEDLMTVATLGFRGEALPSIASVARVEVWTRTRTRDGEGEGTHLAIAGSETPELRAAGAAPGTRIEVRDLFFNTPVRRRFLKRASTEAGHVSQAVLRAALARPDVAFSLTHDGRESFRLAPSDLATRARRVLGKEIGVELRPVSVEGPVGLRGLASHPWFTVASPRHSTFFVNGRPVRDRVLIAALRQAYADVIAPGRHPVAVLSLTLGPGEVDVNVHPGKQEVRFRDSNAVFEVLRSMVRDLVGARDLPRAVVVAERSGAYHPPRADGVGETGRLRLVPTASPARQGPAGAGSVGTLDRGEKTTEGHDSTEGHGSVEGRPAYAPLRILGQVFAGYLLCEGAGELVIVDQHAAEERVAFERLRASWRGGGVESQPLLVPETLELAPGDAEALAEASEDLARLGLEVEPFGESAVVVRAVPALASPRNVRELVEEIAGDLAEHGRTRALDAAAERVLASVACHSVVRVGQRLSVPEMQAVLDHLDATDLATNCPHGRPVAKRISRAELERLFGR